MTGDKTVLLVDDQENIRIDLKQWLERKHFYVHIAASVEEAEHIIKSSQLNFAIVDLKLDYKSDYGGIKVVHLVKQYHPLSKIIILSAYSLDGNIKNQIEGKYNAFVSKGGPENYITAVLKELKKF